MQRMMQQVMGMPMVSGTGASVVPAEAAKRKPAPAKPAGKPKPSAAPKPKPPMKPMPGMKHS